MTKYASSLSLKKTVNVGKLASDEIGVEVLYEDKPVEGATVSLMLKVPMPTLKTAKTDADGLAVFPVGDLFPPEVPIGCAELPYVKWNVMSFVDESPKGVVVDDVTLRCGETYTTKLKEYTEAPTFFLKFELKDVIGRDLFAKVLAEVEKWILGASGFKVTKIEGEGTKALTIYFQPPWRPGSPIPFISWLALHPNITALLLILYFILAILIVVRWTFGEKAGEIIKKGLDILLLAIIASIIASVAAVLKEQRGRLV